MFLALGCIMYRVGTVNINKLDGIGKRMPLTTAALILGGFGLIGVPLTAGFISKWYLVTAALERGWWPLGFLILLSSLLAVIYVWRLVEAAYMRPVPENAKVVEEAPGSLLFPTWFLIGASIYFGIETNLTVGVAMDAAKQLLGGLG